jgi:glucose-6-phosphate isomerase
MRILNYKNVLPFLSGEEIANTEEEVLKAQEKVLNKTGKGYQYTGWVSYPDIVSEQHIEKIRMAADQIRSDSDVLIVIGVGGSYLGAKAALSMLTPYFHQDGHPEVIFTGNSFSSAYVTAVLDYVKNKDFSVNVISKSGTTTEPAVAFRLFRKLLKEKYGDGFSKRIYCTTTIGKGILYSEAADNGYMTFPIPEDIGGRYSVLTPVGLLPMAATGIDIREVIRGAKEAHIEYAKPKFSENDALLYAAIRNLLYRSSRKIEILAPYEPNFAYFCEWYRQLFAESEGKNHRGLYPSSVIFTTDLHSVGQYIQDGERLMFETVISIGKPNADVVMEKEAVDADGLNYLEGKSLHEVNFKAMEAAMFAHTDGGIPNLLITLPEVSAYVFGYLVYFFMFSCSISAYLLDVNPFDQEGVEAYKKNMFALLGKKGYEALKEELEEKLRN